MSKLPHNLTMRCGTSGPRRGCVCVAAALSSLASLRSPSLLCLSFLFSLSAFFCFFRRIHCTWAESASPFQFLLSTKQREKESRERERSLTGSGSLPAHVQVPSDQLHWLYRLSLLSRVPCPMSMSWTLPVNWRISLSFFAAFYR